jgi:hypothetical protein
MGTLRVQTALKKGGIESLDERVGPSVPFIGPY